jgi:hypothetical protein
MSHSKNYDNNKNKVQSKSKSNLVEDLNEMLSVENASVDMPDEHVFLSTGIV